MKDNSFTPGLIGSDSTLLESYTGEPFTGVDGHFVGSDGFIVPCNFVEFYERYPHYVRNWVTKKLKKASNHPDVEDWANTLMMHLCTLPKGRTVPATDTEEEKVIGGKLYNAGFSDVINAFNPWAHYGASAKRFFSFINRCISNKYLSLITKHRKDAMTHVSFALDEPTLSPDMGYNQRDYLLMEKSSLYSSEVNKQGPRDTDQILIEQFKKFVSNADPTLLPVAEAIMEKDGIEEIASSLGMDYNSFIRSRKKLMQLSSAFMPTQTAVIAKPPETPEVIIIKNTTPHTDAVDLEVTSSINERSNGGQTMKKSKKWGKHWCNNGVNERRVAETPEGWVLGRLKRG